MNEVLFAPRFQGARVSKARNPAEPFRPIAQAGSAGPDQGGSRYQPRGSDDRCDGEKPSIASTGVVRLIEASEIAYLVAFLASPQSVAVNGETIAADGGIIGPINY